MKAEACLRKSPFYVFDSMEESINNYLDEVTADRPTGKADEQGAPALERPDAGKILLKEGQHERAGIVEFGNALKRIGYASAKHYASAICNQYNTVNRDMTQILDQAIESKSKCLDDALKKVGPHWDKLNQAKKRYQQVKAEADARRAGPSRVSAVYADEVAAAKEVKRWEGELADLEKLIPKLRKQLEELKRYRQQLQEVTCPTPTKQAAPAAAPPS